MLAKIRAVTLNVWNEQGPHDRRFRLIADGLRSLEADLVALQEVREREGLENQAERLARELEMDSAFAPAATWGGGIEGVAILSRHRILESWSETLPAPDHRRAVLGVRVALPQRELFVASTHLSYRPTEGWWRAKQVVAVDAFCRRKAGRRTALLCGDFNAQPDSDEVRFLRGQTTLAGRRTYWQDAALRVGLGTLPTWAGRNTYAATAAHLEPDRRIDYVFVSPVEKDGRNRILDARLVLDQPDPDGVWPSDHFGVLAEVAVSPDPDLDLPRGKRYGPGS